MDIASMLEVQVNEVNEPVLKENLTPRTPIRAPRATFSKARSPPLKDYSQEENNYFRMVYGLDISAVRFSRIHCTACDAHIGSAPSQVTNMFEHPKLRTLLCSKCYEFYGDGDFEQGDDQTDMFCRWCANGGNLYCCSFCSNTFCSKCIKRNFDAVITKKIEDDEKWKCFVCDPTDVYAARSLCRAVIQHVQTVCRILESDKKMTPAQVEEKMNLDEARCCNRKRKRKRRKTGSSSEDEDDETYTPLISELPQVKRRRTRKSGQYTNIHTNGSLNNRSDEDAHPLLAGENDLLPSMIPCEQTMTEGETALPFGSPTKTPAPSNAPVSLTERVKSPSTLTNNTKVKPVSTVNLLKPLKVRRLTPVSPIPSTPPQKPILLQKRANRPMVSIPQPRSQPPSQPRPQLTPRSQLTPQPRSQLTPQPRSQLTPQPRSQLTPQSRSQLTPRSQPPPQPQPKKARVLLPKPRPTPSVTGTPKIIDLDSDSDEAVEVIEDSGKTTRSKSALQSKSDPKRVESNNKTFEQIILSQKPDIDSELQSIRRKFNVILTDTQTNKPQNVTCGEVSLKMKHFQQIMRKALYRLAQINDRVVREYQGWRKQSFSTASEKMDVECLPVKSPEITLDMTCTRDSESEAEDESVQIGDSTLEASNFEVNQINCYDNLLLFKKMRTVDQAVGDDSVEKVDKATQAYDVRTQDYERSIGYSLLMKAEYDPVAEKEVLKPVEVLNEHFGKYQEQFIFHLQHIEENGIKTTEELESFPDPNETPLKDLIEANSPFITEMLEYIPPAITNGSATEAEAIVTETILDVSSSEEKMEEDEITEIVAKEKSAEEEMPEEKDPEEEMPEEKDPEEEIPEEKDPEEEIPEEKDTEEEIPEEKDTEEEITEEKEEEMPEEKDPEEEVTEEKEEEEVTEEKEEEEITEEKDPEEEITEEKDHEEEIPDDESHEEEITEEKDPEEEITEEKDHEEEIPDDESHEEEIPDEDSFEEEIPDEEMPEEEIPDEENREDAQADSTSATSKAVEELVKMVTQLSDELKSSNNSPENTALCSATEMTDGNEVRKKGDVDKDEETVLAVRTLIEEENSSDNNFNKSQEETGAIEGCDFLN